MLWLNSLMAQRTEHALLIHSLTVADRVLVGESADEDDNDTVTVVVVNLSRVRSKRNRDDW